MTRLLLLFLLLSPTQTNNPSVPKDDSSHSHQGKETAQPSPPVADASNGEHSKVEPAQDRQPASSDKPTMVVVTCVIAFAACVQVGVAAWQACIYQKQARIMTKSLIATKHAAFAALKQVQLQKAQLKQWIELDGWEGRAEPFFPNTVRTTYWLSFWIENPTPMPVTVTRVEITTLDDKPILQKKGPGFTIPPERRYQIKWPTVIADEPTIGALRKGGWNFNLKIAVDFIDAFEDTKSFVFPIGCHCTPTHCYADEYDSRHPD
jgi:hypothetical protein